MYGTRLRHLPLGSADDPHGKRHIVEHIHIVDQPEILEHDAHGAAQIRNFPAFELRQLKIVDDNLSGIRHFFPHDEF